MIVLFCFVSFLTFLFFLKFGSTPLHVAAAQGFEEIVKIFIGHGANVNIQNKVFFLFILYLFILLFVEVVERVSSFFFNFFSFLVLEW